ncbi:hypothetical protein ABT354_11250 [Streptomyces sp. NPDC000594]|uniref:hypothetical protein n=1 Tax=Streptomyces sp. NPDC000594 TaxID=3154261 RepID=UPI00332FDE5F
MNFRIAFEPGWEHRVFQSDGTRFAVTLHATRITADAIRSAPRRSATKDNWNQIRKHISTAVAADQWGWRGNVTVEDHPKVRHAMLQERGWTDRRGRRHPGRHYLKAALLRARAE